jgi:flavin-dependent dehydrogenase
VSVGPLGYTRRAPASDGVMLVGDAAGTIDPMTGQGLALALRGAEIAASAADRALRGHDTPQHAIASYERARAELFRGTWTISRVLQWVIRRPRVAARLFHGLARDPSLASRLLGVVADTRPVRDVVNAGYLIRLIAHASGPSHPYRRAV